MIMANDSLTESILEKIKNLIDQNLQKIKEESRKILENLARYINFFKRIFI